MLRHSRHSEKIIRSTKEMYLFILKIDNSVVENIFKYRSTLLIFLISVGIHKV